VEERAASDDKYTHVFRLENYHFLTCTVKSRMQGGGMSLDCLDTFLQKAEARFADSLEAYIPEMVRYKFAYLLDFFGELRHRLGSMPASDVKFHIPVARLTKVNKENSKTFSKNLKAIAERMAKHLSPEAKLLPLVWGRLTEWFTEEYEAMSTHCMECYGQTLEPSVGAVKVFCEKAIESRR
jgi:hypothetical protein